MHHDTIRNSNQMNVVDFIKTVPPVKIPNITALSNISFGIILTNTFAKQKSFLFSNFVNLDKQKLQFCIIEGETVQEQKLSNYR